MLSLINQYSVVLDACVLAPMPVCETLLRLAEEPAIYIPRWTAQILEELRSTLMKMEYSREQADHRVTEMRRAFEEAEVTCYEPLISSMSNHPKDRHVLAAAVHCGAHAIVTDNVRHFGAEALRPYELEAITADEFLVHQFHLEPELIIDKLREQAADIGLELSSILDSFVKRNAPQFSRLVSETLAAN